MASTHSFQHLFSYPPPRSIQVLIFSTMTRVLDVLQDHLDWRGYRWCRLDGASSAEDRAAQVAEFNAADSPVFAFLLSVRAGGVGLNLQTADTVIMVRGPECMPHPGAMERSCHALRGPP